MTVLYSDVRNTRQRLLNMQQGYYDVINNATANINTKIGERARLYQQANSFKDDSKFRFKTVLFAILNTLMESAIYSGLTIYVIALINQMYVGAESILWPAIGGSILVTLNRICSNKIKATEKIENYSRPVIPVECEKIDGEIAALTHNRTLAAQELNALRRIDSNMDEAVLLYLNQIGMNQDGMINPIELEQTLKDKGIAYQLGKWISIDKSKKK